MFNLPLEVEHIIPVVRGGEDSTSNLALACRACNLFKATHIDARDPGSEEIVRLFNPREDRWDDHFQLVLDSGELFGCTAIGRATVMLLGLNSRIHVNARQQWMRLGLFP